MTTRKSSLNTTPVEKKVLDDCAICLDKISVRGVLDSCQHDFCYDCIYKWSASSNTCPLCKNRFNSISKVQPPSNKRPASPKSVGRPAKRQKVETVAVPYRDLMETQVQPEVLANLRQMMTQQIFDVLLRRYMGRQRIAHREVDGVIDLTEEADEEEDHTPPRFFTFPNVAQVIHLNDLDLSPVPHRAPANPIVIDLTD